MALRRRASTVTVMPKSKYVNAPVFASTTRFPGCGSACMNPVSRSWCNEHRTPRSSRTFLALDRTPSASLKRTPFIHSMTSTLSVLSSGMTRGALTLPARSEPLPPPSA